MAIPTRTVVHMRMSHALARFPDDPAFLKAMIATLQAENEKMSATLRAHDQLIQALRLRIAKLKKQVFGKSSEKIEREIEQLELALEDLLIAAAEERPAPIDETDDAARAPSPAARRKGHAPPSARVGRPRCASAGNWIPAMPAPTAVASCVLWARMSARFST